MKTTAARRRRSDAVMKSGGSHIEGRDEYECHSEELADARQQMATTSSKCRCGVDISLDHRLNEAVLLKKENKLLAAAEILEGIDCNYFAPVHHIITKEAGILKKILRDCSSNTKDIGWTKRVEKRGKKHFSVESKLKRCQNNECTDNYDMLTFRVVTSIEATMLVPVLAVLNESELFSSWAPKFKVPRFGVSKSERLLQLDRCSQVALLEVDHPWPLGMREMIVKAIACEDISTSPSRIVSSLQTMDVENDGEYGLKILPAKNGKRISMESGIVIEKCPLDHPMRETHSSEEDLALFTFATSFQITKNFIVPMRLLNFILAVFFPRAFEMIFRIGEEVRDGKRRAYREVMQLKREELYDYLHERVNAMFRQKRESARSLSLAAGTFSDAGVSLDDKTETNDC